MQRGRRSMGGFRLKGLRRVNQDGKRYTYHRATGTRMPDLPENHPDFVAAYAAAEKRKAVKKPGRPAPGTVLHVWHAYCLSDTHKGLSASYRRVRERDGDKIVQAGGHVPIRTITTQHVRNDMDRLEPHAANERRKTWRALMAFAVNAGFRTDNPTENVKRRATPKTEPHPPWSQDDVQKFRDHWPIGTQQRLAFELMHWTGARVSDMVRLGDGMVDAEGWLTFTQQKTGGEVSIPLRRSPPTFARQADLDVLMSCIEARNTRHLTYVTTEYGASRSQKSASQWFAKAARDAGVLGRSAHGLRKTRAITLAEAGATTHQIGAWTGHESLKEIERYSVKASKKRLLTGVDAEQKMFRGSAS